MIHQFLEFYIFFLVFSGHTLQVFVFHFFFFVSFSHHIHGKNEMNSNCAKNELCKWNDIVFFFLMMSQKKKNWWLHIMQIFFFFFWSQWWLGFQSIFFFYSCSKFSFDCIQLLLGLFFLPTGSLDSISMMMMFSVRKPPCVFWLIDRLSMLILNIYELIFFPSYD